MTVTSDSYESKVSEAVVAMLANSATFRTLVGAGSAAAALAFIVEDIGGKDGKAIDGTVISLAGNYAICGIGPVEEELRAVNTYGHSGVAGVKIMFAVDLTEDPDDRFRAGRNTQGKIKEEMRALFGTSNSYLTAGTIVSEQIELTEATGKNRFHLNLNLVINWRDVP